MTDCYKIKFQWVVLIDNVQLKAVVVCAFRRFWNYVHKMIENWTRRLWLLPFTVLVLFFCLILKNVAIEWRAFRVMFGSCSGHNRGNEVRFNLLLDDDLDYTRYRSYCCIYWGSGSCLEWHKNMDWNNSLLMCLIRIIVKI